MNQQRGSFGVFAQDGAGARDGPPMSSTRQYTPSNDYAPDMTADISAEELASPVETQQAKSWPET